MKITPSTLGQTNSFLLYWSKIILHLIKNIYWKAEFWSIVVKDKKPSLFPIRSIYSIAIIHNLYELTSRV